MAQNLKKVSEYDVLSGNSLTGGDFFYIVRQVEGGAFSSARLPISNLFQGSNNLTTDILFRSNTLVVKNGTVGINTATPNTGYALDVNGELNTDDNCNFQRSVNIGNNLDVGETLNSSICKSGSFKSTNTSNPKSSYTELINIIYPIGSIYMTTSSTNPSAMFGVGEWEEWGSGKVPVGIDVNDGIFNEIEKTGGSKNAVVVEHNHDVELSGKTITQTNNGQGEHKHDRNYCEKNDNFDDDGGPNRRVLLASSMNADGCSTKLETNIGGGHDHPHEHDVTVDGTTDNQGGSGTNKNIQPYIVCYMWKRTA